MGRGKKKIGENRKKFFVHLNWKAAYAAYAAAAGAKSD